MKLSLSLSLLPFLSFLRLLCLRFLVVFLFSVFIYTSSLSFLGFNWILFLFSRFGNFISLSYHLLFLSCLFLSSLEWERKRERELFSKVSLFLFSLYPLVPLSFFGFIETLLILWLSWRHLSDSHDSHGIISNN